MPPPNAATSPSASAPPSPPSSTLAPPTNPQSSHLASPSESTIAVAEVDPSDVPQTESGKLKQLFGILKKTIGVKDLANLRLSLPATFLEPIGNLEYWCYLDRPDIFARIGHEDDELDRMLAVVRFAFSKELKFIDGRICKPYNSVLGEQFKCIYDVTPPTRSATGELELTEYLATTPHKAIDDEDEGDAKEEPPAPTGTAGGPAEHALKKGTAKAGAVDEGKVRVVFLNEQTSHHPPVSNFWLETSSEGKEKVQAYGVDQISAKFTGTSVKCFPGPQNRGIFVNLPGRDEEYEVTHPTANITGFLRGAPNITIGDAAFITRRGPEGSKKGLRAIISYVEEPWLGKPKYLVEGVIYEYEVGKETQYAKPKQVPSASIRATISGTWRTLLSYKLPTSSSPSTEVPLIDLTKLEVLPKSVRALERQGEMESRRFWDPVSSAIRNKEYNKATKNKQAIEQAQRDKAAARQKKKEEYWPVLFEMGYEDGRAKLTEEGRKALKREFDGLEYEQA